MASGTFLELTILAAEQLKNVTLFGGKMNPSAVAFLNPHVKQSTQVIRKGGSNPTWNQGFHIEVYEDVLYDPNASLTIEIFNQSSTTGTVLVGATRLMFQDILTRHKSTKAGGNPEAEEGVMTLQLWRPSGRPHGFLHITLRLVGDFFDQWVSPSEPATGIPVIPPPHYGYYHPNLAPTSSSAPAYPSYYKTTNSTWSSYSAPPPFMPMPVRPYDANSARQKNFLLGLIGGALAGAFFVFF